MEQEPGDYGIVCNDMTLDILVATIIGIGAGTLTGLVPGIHINLVSSVLLANISLLSGFAGSVEVGAFIMAMAVTHVFLDAVPNVFLGAPDESTALSVLPAHRLMLKGEGYTAVVLHVSGALLGLLASILALPVLAWSFPAAYRIIKPYTGIVLGAIAAWMVLREKGLNAKFWALMVFLFAGVLGLTVFRLPLHEPLLPLLSGLFGASGLILSINSVSNIPHQRAASQSVGWRETFPACSSGLIAGSVIALLPGLGPTQAGSLSSFITPRMTPRGFLVMMGAVSIANMVVSIATMLALGKARNGALVVALEVLGKLTFQTAVILALAALVAGAAATMLCLQAAKRFGRVLPLIPYRAMCASALCLIVALVAWFSGWLGLGVLAASTAV
ncbi:tripartite tricarboxylate transporter permease, partial [Candidatus Woesearchaeota archaeon]|nr:tripartite tricarboxylate transporter permease [Candidatus Woesearchaeota archaeon]